MQSKNKSAPSAAERRHIEMVKGLPCSVLDEEGTPNDPIEVHEIKQGQWYTSVALKRSTHDALHGKGDKWMWRLKKMDEVDALAVTLRRVFERLMRRLQQFIVDEASNSKTTLGMNSQNSKSNVESGENDILDKLKSKGISIISMGHGKLRMVTHLDYREVMHSYVLETLVKLY